MSSSIPNKLEICKFFQERLEYLADTRSIVHDQDIRRTTPPIVASVRWRGPPRRGVGPYETMPYDAEATLDYAHRGLCPPWINREIHPENGVFTLDTFHQDVAMVIMDNAIAHRKTQSRAFVGLFGSKERSKDA